MAGTVKKTYYALYIAFEDCLEDIQKTFIRKVLKSS